MMKWAKDGGWPLALIWAGLIVRLAFYATMLPLWEPMDEWAHFAVVQSTAIRGELLARRERPIPRNIEASLGLAPLPWELRRFASPSVTHDNWWQLPETERRARIEALRAIPESWAREDGSGAFSNYEAQQPPLYYWIAGPLVWLMRGWSLASQVVALRWLTALLASLTLPLVYRIACELFADRRMALGCAAVLAVMPGFAGAVARVSNDGLAAPLYALLLWTVLRYWRKPSAAAACAVGTALGLALLTKAYFLTAAPVAVALLLWCRSTRRAGLAACSIPLLTAGWWYLRSLLADGSLLTTGSMSGLEASPASVLKNVPSVPWVRAVDAILFSHIYCLGWSWLTVRSWMYHTFYILLALAVVGLAPWLRRPGMRWLLAFYAFFCAGELWHAALMYTARGIPASMGWYLYGAVAAEVPLAVAGLSTWLPAWLRQWAAPVCAALFAALDLFAMHVLALPYYAGLIRHASDGSLHFAHWNTLNLPLAFARLTLPAALWIAYVVASAGVVILAIRNSGRKNGFAAY